jgi:DNA-binding NarL/FixJ family response regulator
MEPAEQILVTYGCAHLLHDIIAEALADYGWKVINPRSISDSTPVEIALICASASMEMTLETVECIHLEHPGARIVLLGSGLDDDKILRLIRSGIGAYVDTSQGFPDLLDTIKMVRENRSPSRSRLTSLVLEDISRLTSGVPEAISKLTLRESQVLELLVKGSSNKEIADSLSITLNTVKNHVHNLLEKLNVKSRHQAVWMTTRQSMDYKKAG